MYTKKVNKIALSSNDDKIPTFDEVITFPYGTDVFVMLESEMLLKTNGKLIKSYY